MASTTAALSADMGGSSQRDKPTPRRLPVLQHYLEEQQDLTAVERFSQLHSEAELPEQAKYYKSLLPSAKPKSGQQYAFSVDLDKCTGCKACVTACHNLNGLDDDETWRAVGLLHGGSAQQPVQQTVTAACHHCVDPACMTGCPVNAYEKDPETGIVRHLDDQCIGCQYCTLTCPYEVPQYNKRLGIVRKCDLCVDRLKEGEAPACVQGCPNEAIAVRVVDTQQVLEDAQADEFLPGAPSPGITLPTTEYKTTRVFPKNTIPADFYSVRPATNHVPLVLLLVFTQLSVGAFCTAYAVNAFVAHDQLQRYHALVALALGLLALVASVAHLGRPQFAFRAVLNLRRSWMSREIACFGLFAGLAVAYAGSAWADTLTSLLALPALGSATLGGVRRGLGFAVAAVGLLGVYSSAMLYTVTGRRWWSLPQTCIKFFATTWVLGLGLSLLVFTIASALGVASDAATLSSMLGALALGMTFKLVVEASVFSHLRHKQHTDLKRTALLLRGELGRLSWARFALGIGGGLVMPLLMVIDMGSGTTGGYAPVVLSGLGLLALVAGELIERSLFFMAVAHPRMPGAVGA